MNRFAIALASLLAALMVACSSSTKTDAGARPDAGIDAGEPDSGIPDAGCAQAGYSCDSNIPCCDTLDQVCDLVEDVCVFVVDGGVDGGPPSIPSDGAQWLEEGVDDASSVGVDALSIPSPFVQLSASSGPGVGQILLRTPDAGWVVLAGAPAATAMLGIWADATGDVFAAGLTDAGPLLVQGKMGGPFVALDVPNQDGGPPFVSLSSILGLGPGEAIAVGVASEHFDADAGLTSYAPAVALHLFPDGGIAFETLPLELDKVYRLTGGGDGGPIYALANDTADVGSWVLERENGLWSAEEVFGAGMVTDIAVGPAGDVTVAGDDGNGHGEVFTRPTDGGYFPVEGLPALPPLTAVCEPAAGQLYFAASAPNVPLELLHLDGGLPNGSWWTESVPADAQSVAAIAGDGAGNFFAGGVRACSNCAGFPLVLKRMP